MMTQIKGTKRGEVELATLKSLLCLKSYKLRLHLPLWNQVKFIDRDPHRYTRRVKEAIQIRLHSNNINRDNGIEIPEAWMRSESITAVQLQSGPVREHHLLIGIIRIEIHQSQRTNVHK